MTNKKITTRKSSRQKSAESEQIMSPIKSYSVKGTNIEIPAVPDIFTTIEKRQQSINSLNKYLEQLIRKLESSPETLEVLGCTIDDLNTAMNTWLASDHQNVQRLHGRLPEEGSTFEHFYLPYLKWMDDQKIPYQHTEALSKMISDQKYKSQVVEQLVGILEVNKRIHHHDSTIARANMELQKQSCLASYSTKQNDANNILEPNCATTPNMVSNSFSNQTIDQYPNGQSQSYRTPNLGNGIHKNHVHKNDVLDLTDEDDDYMDVLPNTNSQWNPNVMVHTIQVKDLPEFSGNESVEEARQWRTKFVMLAKSQQWTPVDQKQYFKLCMKAGAKQWFKRRKNLGDKDIKMIMASFNEEYCVHGTNAMERYYNCTMKKSEPLLTFIDRMDNLYFDLKTPSGPKDLEAHIRRIISRSNDQGLLSRYGQLKTTDELRQYVKDRDLMWIEQEYKRERPRTKHPTPGTTYYGNQYQHPNPIAEAYSDDEEAEIFMAKSNDACSFCGGPHFSKYCFTKMKQNKCDICEHRGHFRESCKYYCTVCKTGHIDAECEAEKLLELLRSRNTNGKTNTDKLKSLLENMESQGYPENGVHKNGVHKNGVHENRGQPRDFSKAASKSVQKSSSNEDRVTNNNNNAYIHNKNSLQSYFMTKSYTTDTYIATSAFIACPDDQDYEEGNNPMDLTQDEILGDFDENEKPKPKIQAIVAGSVNNHRQSIILDTGANQSSISGSLAMELGLEITQHPELHMRGIGKDNVEVLGTSIIKITLNTSKGKLAYRFRIWVLDTNIPPLLGMDFLMKAGARIDCRDGQCQLPGEACIQLLGLEFLQGFSRKFKLGKTVSIKPGHSFVKTIGKENGKTVWVRRFSRLIPTIIKNKNEISVRLTNITDRIQCLDGNNAIAIMTDPNSRPPSAEYSNNESLRYKDWQLQIADNYMPYSEEVTKRNFKTLIKELEDKYPTKPNNSVTEPVRIQKPERSGADQQKQSLEELEENLKVLRHTLFTAKVAGELQDEDYKAQLDPDELERNLEVLKHTLLTAEATGEETRDVQENSVLNFNVQNPSTDSIEKPLRDHYRHEPSELSIDDLSAELALIPDITELDEDTKIDIDKVINELDIGEPPETTDADHDLIRNVLRKHKHILNDGEALSLPPEAKDVVCDIKVTSTKPIKQRCRPIDPKFREKLYDILKSMLKYNIIEPSDSPWASPIVIVVKKDGENIRLCIDYREVNKVTDLYVYNMPDVNSVLQQFEACRWFCTLDMVKGFHAIRMTSRAKRISAFITPFGLFQWNRMPMGLKNAPQIYQWLLDNCLYGFLKPISEDNRNWRTLESYPPEVTSLEKESNPELQILPEDMYHTFKDGLVDEESTLTNLRTFVDDAGLGASTVEKCAQQLDLLLTRLGRWNIHISLKKSEFLKSRVQLLGHMISREGIYPLPKTIDALQELPFPTTQKGMKSFLGSVIWFSRFLPHMSALTAILNGFTTQSHFDNIPDEAVKAFNQLKKLLATYPILAHPAKNGDIHIKVYSCQWAIGAVIMQEQDGQMKLVKYTSRTLKDAESRYSDAEKDILALLRVLSSEYSIVVGKSIFVYSRWSTPGWIFRSKSLPNNRVHQFATMLSPWPLTFVKVGENDPCLGVAKLVMTTELTYQQYDEMITDYKPAKIRDMPLVHPELWKLNADASHFFLSFDGASNSAKPTEPHAACSFVLWKYPAWDILDAKGIYLNTGTVNDAEYNGVLAGLKRAKELGIKTLNIWGDSQIVINQIQGLYQANSTNLQLWLGKCQEEMESFDMIRTAHVKRNRNQSADHLASLSRRLRTDIDLDTPGLAEDLKKLFSEHNLFFPDSKAETATKLNTYYQAITYLSDLPGTSDIQETDAETQDADHREEETETRHVHPSKAQIQDFIERVPQFFPPNSQSEEEPMTQTQEFEKNLRELPPQTTKGLQQERIRRINLLQQRDPDLKKLIYYKTGQYTKLSKQEMQKAAKVGYVFDITHTGTLVYVADNNRRYGPENLEMKIVIPKVLRREILAEYHNSKLGGHQGVSRTYDRIRKLYYWTGLYRDVADWVLSCPDCQSKKGRPLFVVESPGNILPQYPAQVVSMDLTAPLPTTPRGFKYLLMCQLMFSGYVIAIPLKNKDAMEVAKAYYHHVFLRFGASEVLRSDRGKEFLNDVMKQLLRIIGTKARSTMAYRPQANGQQERSIQTIVNAIKAYTMEPDQTDWDELAIELCFAINTSKCSTRLETPHFITFGWDAKTTFDAMLPDMIPGAYHHEPKSWRTKIQRQHQWCQEVVLKLQEAAKQKRAAEHNEKITENLNKKIEVGRMVWVYIPRVKKGLTKKLSHLWFGPFRIIKVNHPYVELDLTASKYRFHNRVHIHRIKLHRDYQYLPQNSPDEEILDEALMIEDIETPSSKDNEYEIEAILDSRIVNFTHSKGPRKGRSSRRKEYLIKWKNYGEEDNSWVPEEDISNGKLLFDFMFKNRFAHRSDALLINE